MCGKNKVESDRGGDAWWKTEVKEGIEYNKRIWKKTIQARKQIVRRCTVRR